LASTSATAFSFAFMNPVLLNGVFYAES